VADFMHGNLYHFDLNQNRTQLMLNGSSLADGMAQHPKELADMIFTKAPGGISDMELGPDGYLYILSLSEGAVGDDCTPTRTKNCVDYDAPSILGGIFKLVPAPHIALSE
jgi:hypothetical protein